MNKYNEFNDKIKIKNKSAINKIKIKCGDTNQITYPLKIENKKLILNG